MQLFGGVAAVFLVGQAFERDASGSSWQAGMPDVARPMVWLLCPP